MIHTDGRPTVAHRAADAVLAGSANVDPADVRDCDGYPGLSGLEAIRTRRLALAAQLQRSLDELGLPRLPRAYGVQCCGDPGDCGACPWS